MKQLQFNWLTEGIIDYEYKKYILLAYLQEANKELNIKKLFPILKDLLFHYQNLLNIKNRKSLLYEHFPESLSRADFQKLKLSYTKMVQDDDVMEVIEEILQYALPRFKQLLEEGREIYGYIEAQLEIEHIGITPLYMDEGYLFLHVQEDIFTKIFRYQISVYASHHEKYRDIHINYLDSIKKSVGSPYEKIKLQLIKKFKDLPNPATFLVYSKVTCPFNETLLPIASKSLVKHISAMVA
ncbi:hypothetical protein AAG747_26070 [Rapidithrix thailandica]|uniref:Uncharacterized protein n=1 Tax=Rapidithrix thailandica TaxID=413964 RepID=A0AAW9S892_9BACT